MFVHRRKNLFAYAVLFDEVAEFTDGCLVRGSFSAEVDPDKFAHRLAVIEAIFGLRVRQIKPVLQEVDPQHSLDANRRTASLARGIMGLDQAAQLPPRDDSVHLAQEVLTLRLLVVGLKTYAGKCHLAHGNLAGRLNQIKRDLPRPRN